MEYIVITILALSLFARIVYVANILKEKESSIYEGAYHEKVNKNKR